MGEHGNDTTSIANQVSPFFLQPTDSLCQIVMLRLHRHKTCSAAISIYTYRLPELRIEAVQTSLGSVLCTRLLTGF